MLFKKIMLLAAIIPLFIGFTGCDSGGGGDGGGNVDSRTAGGGFLWKPRSESNGRLVVLFPNEFRGLAVNGAIHREDPPRASNLIENGTFAGDTHNGARVHYRFSQTGAAYGANVYAVITLQDGQRISYFIPNGAGRVE